jgi:hypothetical protein
LTGLAQYLHWYWAFLFPVVPLWQPQNSVQVSSTSGDGFSRLDVVQYTLCNARVDYQGYFLHRFFQYKYLIEAVVFKLFPEIHSTFHPHHHLKSRKFQQNQQFWKLVQRISPIVRNKKDE